MNGWSATTFAAASRSVASITDLDAIRPAFAGIEGVLHLGVSVDVDNWDDQMSVTALGTLNVFRAAQEAGGGVGHDDRAVHQLGEEEPVDAGAGNVDPPEPVCVWPGVWDGGGEEVPDEERVFVLGIEMVNPAQSSPHLQNCFFMFLRIGHFKNDIVEIAANDAGLLRRRKIASHCRIGSVKIIVIRPAVIGVLLLLLQHANHSIGNSLDGECSAHGGLSTE